MDPQKFFMGSKNFMSGSLWTPEEEKLKKEAIWLNSLSQEAVEPSLSGSPHCCEHWTSLGNCVVQKWGKAMLRKETWAMRVIQLPTSMWRFEINELKRQKSYLGSRFHSKFHWTKLLQASGKAEHFGWGMQRKKWSYSLYCGWEVRREKRESGVKDPYSALGHASKDLLHPARPHLLTFYSLSIANMCDTNI